MDVWFNGDMSEERNARRPRGRKALSKDGDARGTANKNHTKLAEASPWRDLEAKPGALEEGMERVHVPGSEPRPAAAQQLTPPT